MTTLAIVQARMGSTRLPGKVMRRIRGVPMLSLLLGRLRGAKRLDGIVVATTVDRADDVLAEYLAAQAVQTFRGSATDVLDRYYVAALSYGADVVVRITADCPLVDTVVVDRVVETLRRKGADYASNTAPPTFPDGLDVEAFTFAALEQAWRQATTSYDREHVTPYMKQAPSLRRINLTNATDLSASRWTVDEPEDLAVIRGVFDHFAPHTDFGWEAVAALEKSRPELFAANRDIARNEA